MGFDRLVFHGTLRTLASLRGMRGYLSYCNILFKDFAEPAQPLTHRIKQAALRPIQQAGRPVEYVPSAQTSTEELAKQIAARDAIHEGPIGLLTSLEGCPSYDVAFNHTTQQLQLRARTRKCLHFYPYQIDPVFGLLHVRLQTWFPFHLPICLNGREGLARQMDQEGIGYERNGSMPNIPSSIPTCRTILWSLIYMIR